ncbi:MAG TPA: ATP-binding protein [Acidobacteriaceae bacterium]|jgi:signal transduction histidine kinase|nr:ATP-binding protein [Acidobacteriaceae bacterium]
MNLLVSGAVLVLAALAFFSYDLISFRLNLIHSIETEAQIVGENSVSALIFNDPVSAATTLQGLRRSPDIVCAVLATNDGAEFATYSAPGVAVGLRRRPLPARESEHYWLSGSHLLLAHRVVFQGKAVGVVYISATLTEIGQRARHYLLITMLILLFCMVAALAISSVSQRLVAQPIISLARTARGVSRDRDYSVRAEPSTASTEMAVLTDAFNEMLQQIEQQDAALSRARDELELRVEERTSELQAANRELEAFSYTVAHDLRGPLDSISGIAFLLSRAEQEGSHPETEEMIQRLKQSTQNMAALIDDLLNFSRASTATLKKDDVDLSAMAHEIAKDLMDSDPERKVEFQIAELPSVQADSALMHIVMDNLIRNAWKYTSHHEKACIEVGAKLQNGKMIYFVRDDGAGFDPQRADQIFQPFHRLHSKSEFPGTGVGLATVQRILTRHGGDIWAEGRVEKGATFYFRV